MNYKMPIEAIKGFNKDMTCRGFQFEIGKTYEHDGKVVRCTKEGFHAVEMPLDVFRYYPLSTSVYASVEMRGTIDRAEEEDTKIAAAEITIRAEIKLPEIIKRAVDWIVNSAKGNIGQGDSGHAAATGDGGHAAATGYRGHAAATGDRGHAAATGYRGHAAATGDRAHAAATGDGAHAAATGDGGHAAATGDSGHAAATGDRAHAAATGYGGHAAATGDSGHAAATGYRGHAAATGDRAHAAATGYSGHAAATGDRGHAAATGYSGHAAVSGKNAIAASLGIQSTAKASVDGWIVLALWKQGEDYKWQLQMVKTAKVGGPEGIKPDTTYKLKDSGDFEECEP
jgi:hypothetical protein